MIPVDILIKSDTSNNIETVNALKISIEKIENFELLDSHILVKLKEHFLAIPREYHKQVANLFDIIKC